MTSRRRAGHCPTSATGGTPLSPHAVALPGSCVGRLCTLVLALALLAAGLFLLIGGFVLVLRGGSWYFLVAGAFIVLSAFQVARGRVSGAWLFLAVFAGTVLWAIAEVGLDDYWGLVSRLLAMTFGAAVVAFTLPALRRADGARAGRIGPYLGVPLLIAGMAGFGSMFFIHPEVPPAEPAAAIIPVAPGHEQKNWAHYGNDPGHGRFAALAQINIANVD